MNEVLLTLVIVSLTAAAGAIRRWTTAPTVLTATMFLMAWTLSAMLVAFVAGGPGAALLALVYGAPYAVLVLWAFEPVQGPVEPPSDVWPHDELTMVGYVHIPEDEIPTVDERVRRSHTG